MRKLCVCLLIIIEVQTALRFSHIYRNTGNCKNDFVLIVKELSFLSIQHNYRSTVGRIFLNGL